MALAPLPPIGAASAGLPATGVADRAPAAGFGEALQRGLGSVSAMEHAADGVAQSLATGGPAQVHDLMVAATKSQVGVDALVAVRNRAIEAYQDVMRLQV